MPSRTTRRPRLGTRAPARVIIEAVHPEIDAGRFPIKRTPGEDVRVTADIFADGHDRLAAAVLSRRIGADAPAGGDDWRESAMEDLGNDRWSGRFVVDQPGWCEFTVEAWIDRFATWLDGTSKKFAAGQDVELELAEGAALVQAASARAAAGAAADSRGEGAWLASQAAVLGAPGDQAHRVAVAFAPRLRALMRAHADRTGAARHERCQPVLVERERARFSTWYEMFPRSAGVDPGRSGTFADAAERLPEIAAMGFDVLYLPPIHPIGRRFRKGRNNALEAAPGDPGSPWAIGAAEGGHTAVEPGLGTLEDFDRFLATARRLGLEIALDLAFQTAPDHPYVEAHPEWFHHRPDGSIQYAENPPKKYQDIYPFDFESPHWRRLYEELRDVTLFWAARGVRIFRVDNPHTKPFRFWEWLFAEVRSRHADTIFLAEAFTRPKVMRYLAKIGFSQSYTYFTWRNTREEITEYFTELTTTGVAEYMRPNLFVNTPDILHEYLQRGGRPAFQVRLLLAATLGASYGIYSGFELAENEAVPGTEEYADSEKYQWKRRDWNRPGHLKEFVARVNQVRREVPALQYDRGLRFHPTDNGALVAYSKGSPEGRSRVFVVVNLDPFNLQHGWVRVPIADWGIRPDAAYWARDLVSGERYPWRGEWNYVRLEPGIKAGHLFTFDS